MAYIDRYYRRQVDFALRFKEITDEIFRPLRDVGGGAVLNVGCGPMFFDNAVYFATPPERYVGVDLNEAAIDYLQSSDHPNLAAARDRFRESSGIPVLLAGDIADPDLPLEGRFDYVLAIGVIGALWPEQSAHVVRCIGAFLKPGGRLIKVTWHGARRTPEEHAEKKRYSFDSNVDPTPAELVEHIVGAGFAVVTDNLLTTDPATYQWEMVQTSVFQRTGDVGFRDGDRMSQKSGALPK